MKILVTGAAGQLGTVVCRYLLEQPHVEQVIGGDLRPLQLSDDRLRFESLDIRDGEVPSIAAGWFPPRTRR